ncbi:MAG: hypothetical protein VW338_04680 [Rhodospirillaceae bacterium]
MTSLVLWIGAIDALAVMLTGAVAAAQIMLGRDMTALAQRFVPAVAILVGTSFSAAIIVEVSRRMIE